jgi:hypothetical protein
MPWTFYAGMTDEDLGAIYDYLRTVPPVKNKVSYLQSTESEVFEYKEITYSSGICLLHIPE